jgi:rhodanese-related sulfurtransferase
MIDVGEPADYAAGHPAGARNVPLAQIAGHKGLPSNKALPLVVTASKSGLAGRAATALRQAGHEKVLMLAGGLAAWREANLPIDKSA